MTLTTARKRFGVLLALFLFLVAAPALRADPLTWTWQFTGSTIPGGPTIYGTGSITTLSTITTVNNPIGVTPSGPQEAYTITDITGTWGSQTITGLEPIGSTSPLDPFGATNNLLYLSTSNVDDIYGLIFDTDGTPSTWRLLSDAFFPEENNITGTDPGLITYFGTFYVTPSAETSPVPEPSSIVLLGTSLVALASLLWYRKQDHAASNA